MDIGSIIHYARAFNWRGQELSKKAFHFSNDLDSYHAFAKWLNGYRQSMDAEKVYVGCEPTEHYWFNFARYVKQSCMTLVLVNPYHVKQTKELDDNRISHLRVVGSEYGVKFCVSDIRQSQG